jgi:hypothetical protein
LLIHDELERRRDRLVARRIKNAAFRDIRTLDTFNWTFNPTIDRALIFELATGRFIERREDALILGNPGTGKSHIAQAIGMAAIHGGFHVLYRAAHKLFEALLSFEWVTGPGESRFIAYLLVKQASTICDRAAVMAEAVEGLRLRPHPFHSTAATILK